MLLSSTLRSAREHLRSIRPSSSTARSAGGFENPPLRNLFFFVGAAHASPCINNSSPVEEREACLALFSAFGAAHMWATHASPLRTVTAPGSGGPASPLA